MASAGRSRLRQRAVRTPRLRPCGRLLQKASVRRNVEHWSVGQIANRLMRSIKLRVLFIAGIHGSGKSTLAKALSAAHDVTAYTASELIKFQPADTDFTKKAVADVDENQVRLLASIAELAPRLESVIVDGHFCLLDSNHTVQRVPEAVFRRMAPVAVLLVREDLSRVYQRLAARDGVGISLPLLSALDIAEHRQATEISSTLGVSFMVWNEAAGFGVASAFLAAALAENPEK